jgi:serine/threonine protein kinase
VLVWFALEGSGTPGVVVRHADVLALHGVGSHTGGPYLVTEGVAATPLPGLLDQRPLTHQEAATFTARLAQALQAFHDQGACHGRLSADWVLVRGDLEPLLCPCGSPSRSAVDRTRDVADLGRMLRGCRASAPRAATRS